MIGIHLSFLTHANVSVDNTAYDVEKSQKWNNIYIKDENHFLECLLESQMGNSVAYNERKVLNINIPLPSQ